MTGWGRHSSIQSVEIQMNHFGLIGYIMDLKGFNCKVRKNFSNYCMFFDDSLDAFLLII